jgi:ABC-type Na+ transport system ATPase subunit NatA
LGRASKPHGIFIVDEVESGLYFRRQNSFIEQMRRFAEENQTQIFARRLIALSQVCLNVVSCPELAAVRGLWPQESPHFVGLEKA